MKVKFLPISKAPSHYSFDGESITAFFGGKIESFDLSPVISGGRFVNLSVDELDLVSQQILRDVYRDSSGELHVVLCQQVGPGHWEEGPEIDASNYDPTAINVFYNVNKHHLGIPWVVTSEGERWVR